MTPDGGDRRFAPVVLVLVCSLAFALRVAVGIVVPPTPSAELSDTLWYHETAKLLAQGRGYVNPFTGYPTASWPPGYPLILAAAYVLLGMDPRTGVLVNAVAGALTCACCYRLGTLTSGSSRAGLIAASLIALLPSHVFFAPLLLTESVFAPIACAILLAAGLLLQASVDRGRLWRWVVWGVAVGAASLVRAEGVCLLPVAVAAALVTRGIRRAIRVLAGAALGLSCVLAPWTYRNAGVFHAFVPLSTGFGRSFWIGHNDAATGGMSVALQDLAIERIERPLATVSGPDGELQRNRRSIALALDYAAHHPGREAVLFLARIYHLFRGDHQFLSYYEYRAREGGVTETTRTVFGRLANVVYVLVLVPAVAGWLLFLRSPSPLQKVLALFPVFWILLFALLHGDPRFHFPLMPIFCVMATRSLIDLRHRRGSTRPHNDAANRRETSLSSGGPKRRTNRSANTATQ